MKTQISANSHQPEKHYTGVYMQQGRMILDADWNEQIDIHKQLVQDNCQSLIGSGIPKQGGITISQSGNISAGEFFVDGVKVTLPQAIKYDAQPFYPLAPEIKAEMVGVLFADVWEQEITSIQDSAIRDLGLQGADTCSRTRQVVQFKWLESQDNKFILPPKGDSKCTISIRNVIDNGLFRIELHSFNEESKEVVFKWSMENGAEQYRIGDIPPDFKQENYVFESFDDDDELLRGWHPNAVNQVVLSKDIASPRNNDSSQASGKTYVRRWDDYIQLNIETGVVIAGDDRNGFSEDVSGNELARTYNYKAENRHITLQLDNLKVEITLGENLFSGDYWQVPVRIANGELDQILIEKQIPLGVEHKYLPLAKIDGKKFEIFKKKQFSFPSLGAIDAEDVSFKSNSTVKEQLIVLNEFKAKNQEREARLALFGRGVIHGMIPELPKVDYDTSDKVLKVTLKMMQEAGGSIIDGTGKLWFDTLPAETEFLIPNCKQVLYLEVNPEIGIKSIEEVFRRFDVQELNSDASNDFLMTIDTINEQGLLVGDRARLKSVIKSKFSLGYLDTFRINNKDNFYERVVDSMIEHSSSKSKVQILGYVLDTNKISIILKSFGFKREHIETLTTDTVFHSKNINNLLNILLSCKTDLNSKEIIALAKKLNENEVFDRKKKEINELKLSINIIPFTPSIGDRRVRNKLEIILADHVEFKDFEIKVSNKNASSRGFHSSSSNHLKVWQKVYQPSKHESINDGRIIIGSLVISNSGKVSITPDFREEAK